MRARAAVRVFNVRLMDVRYDEASCAAAEGVFAVTQGALLPRAIHPSEHVLRITLESCYRGGMVDRVAEGQWLSKSGGQPGVQRTVLEIVERASSTDRQGR